MHKRAFDPCLVKSENNTCKINFDSVFLLVTSGVRVDPRSGTVDLEGTAVEHLGETRTHLETGEKESSSRLFFFNLKDSETL